MDIQDLKVDAVLICDDIRKEVSGKAILIGVYVGDIVVDRVPATLPIAVWLQGRFPSGGELKVNIHLGEKGSESESPVDSIPTPRGENGEFSIALGGFMLNISEPTSITVRIKKNQDDWAVVARKKILVKAPTNASSSETPQPS